MSILTVRILLFCLIPIGIFILFHGIKFLRKSIYGRIILEFPYSSKTERFKIEKPGIYSIWQKGEMFKITPVNEFKPYIYCESTAEKINLRYSLLSPRVNDFSTGRMELFTFKAKEGLYRIELKVGSSIFGLQRMLSIKSGDTSKYFLQIRESQSQIFAFLGIPMCLIGGFGILGGLIVGILADKIFL